MDTRIHDAVQNGRLQFLRARVQELLRLQPKRDDMRKLLEVLPNETEFPPEFTNSIGMRFMLIEPGEFMMGSNDFDDEQPPHRVRITQPFYLGVFPVTQAEYIALTGKNGRDQPLAVMTESSRNRTPSHFTGDTRCPVENVSWNDAVDCCERLSQVGAEEQRDMTYRLPTEAEWEYACRAGSTGKWSFGDNKQLLGEYAWFENNSSKMTHPVGKKKANAWGLHDMHGNVWELCEDVYNAKAYASRRGKTTNDPLVTSGSDDRVLRGGSWGDISGNVRSPVRHRCSADYRYHSLGFRMVCWPSS